ncbi:MAG: peptidase S51, partial [Nostoc sp. TH1S01]|nr:peptidase S51 [Nostoc sp. TH1S01]
MIRLFIHPERIDDESENYDYHLTNCDRVNSNSSHPTACILLIGGGEGNTPGEDAATRWFLNNADRGDYLVLRFGEIGSQADWICNRTYATG